MDLGITGRVAVVAAASKGLGRAVAEELAANGARVVICARGKEALEAVAEQIRGRGGEAHAVVADVTDPAQVSGVVAEAERAFGPVDILFTNSGGPKPGRFETLTLEDWDAAARILLTSAVAFTQAVLPGMRERKWGRIINITSIAAKQPVENLMLSNALRAAVTGFAKTLAAEVAAEGVTVNTLIPGYTRTERVVELAQHIAKTEGITPDEAEARWKREIPMGRIGEPREFAAMAAFLASDRASYVTGQSVAVDGGWIRSLF
jgi:3-oxoacyl-[acyl-carrier protein] reductase